MSGFEEAPDGGGQGRSVPSRAIAGLGAALVAAIVVVVLAVLVVYTRVSDDDPTPAATESRPERPALVLEDGLLEGTDVGAVFKEVSAGDEEDLVLTYGDLSSETPACQQWLDRMAAEQPDVIFGSGLGGATQVASRVFEGPAYLLLEHSLATPSDGLLDAFRGLASHCGHVDVAEHLRGDLTGIRVRLGPELDVGDERVVLRYTLEYGELDNSYLWVVWERSGVFASLMLSPSVGPTGITTPANERLMRRFVLAADDRLEQLTR